MKNISKLKYVVDFFFVILFLGKRISIESQNNLIPVDHMSLLTKS